MKASTIFAAGISLAAVAWSQGAYAQATGQGAPSSAAPSPVQDQDADTKSVVNDATEIVVTATRRSESLQNVPMSVDVVTGQQIQKFNIVDPKDIGRLSPGLDITNQSGRSNAITLRGIGFDPDQGTGPAVQTYLNEVPTDAQTLFTALYDVGQIEVLRGAQGLLRGLSAPAGAVTITTQRPYFDRAGGYAQLTGSDRHAVDGQFGVTYPLSQTLSVRVAGLFDENRLNQLKNVSNGTHSNSKTESGRITIGWRPTDRLTAYLTYQYLSQKNRQDQQVFGPGNAPALVPFGDTMRSGPAISLDDYESVTEGPASFKNHTNTLNLNAVYDLGGADLTVVGGYQSTILKIVRDVDTGNSIPGYLALATQRTPYFVTTGDVRLASKGDGVLGWSLGAFYQQQRGTTHVTQPADSFFGTFPYSYGLYLPIATDITVPAHAQTLSFNANGRIKVSTLTFEGGLRYTIEKSTRVANIVATSPGFAGNSAFGIPTIPPFSFTSDGVPANLKYLNNHPLTGGATLTWVPAKDFTVYASYGHSFRSGSVAIGSPSGVSDNLIASRNEQSDSYEVGVKGSVLEHRLSYAVAAFYQKFDGFLSRFGGIAYNCRDFFGSCNAGGPPINNATDIPPTNGNADFNYNGNATVKGIEVELNARPTRYWDIGLHATYDKARYAKGTLLPCDDYNGDGKADATGVAHITGTGNVSFCQYHRLADVPDFSLSATSELRIPTSGPVEPYLRGLLSYRPSVYSERLAFDLPSRTIVDAYIGARIDDGKFEIALFSKNLLNQKRLTFITSGNATSAAGASFYDSGYRIVAMTVPREIGLTGSVHF
jgi:iron complex outermembrane receptor protein